MKKAVLLLSIIFMIGILGGCSSNISTKKYNGKVTDLSKKFLDKGYAINIYRSGTPLGDDVDSLGKHYITMTFGILADYISSAGYNPNADYNIKKVIVSNVKVLSTSKMGIVDDLVIMKSFSQSLSDPHISVVGTQTKYEIINDIPNTSGGQAHIMVNLSKIALYDETKSAVAASGGQPSLAAIYNELGITRDEVALKIGFRIELLTLSNKTLYKDYEIIVPPVGTDIGSTEYHYEFYEKDTIKMQPFLEKN